MRLPIELGGGVPVALLLLATGGAAQKSPSRVVDLIDPLIGTINGGHVFPGATLPFGMVKAGADTNGENQGGFDSKSRTVRGFSHMHDSGTGGGSSMGNFPIFAHSSCEGDDVNNCPFEVLDREADWLEDSVEASPGYFGISLNNSISVETTVTNRSALYRITFPDESTQAQNASLSPLILVDMTDLSETRSESKVSVDAKTGRLTGSGSFNPSFGSGTYSMYFCMDFDGAELRRAGGYTNNGSVIIGPGSDPEVPSPLAAFAQFQAPDNEDNQILARVGISFISTQQACSNAEKEQPDFDFDGTVKAAEAAWEEKFSVVEIDTEGVDKDFEVIFWSGIYRTMISPQDYTGENPLWESDEPYYDSFYCMWDSYRSIHPLLTMLDPHSQTLMIRSLIDIYRHEGWLPDCRMSLCKGFTQGGSNADVVLVDAFVKNLTGIDWDTAYEALIKDAEVQPPNWDLEGRGGIESWKTLGYIPKDDEPGGEGLHSRSVSRTVEYAYNDFCIALMAKAIGNDDDYTKYAERSNNWKNLYKRNQTSFIDGEDTGFVGYLQPRLLDGSWDFQNPIHCSPLLNQHSCYLNEDGGESYEGPLWMYTFYVPQDMATLITTVGGPEAYTNRLDYLHESGLLYLGDEQAFLPVYQYHYVGRPALSAHRAHTYIPSQFNNTIGGIPGNDDSGAMGSFLALALMGLFPVPGQNVYLITPPFFPEVNIKHGITGKTATIKNVGFDPSYDAIYIQSVKRDGEKWTKNWIGHDFFADGGVLELELGKEESEWGTRKEDLPPSLSTGGF